MTTAKTCRADRSDKCLRGGIEGPSNQREVGQGTIVLSRRCRGSRGPTGRFGEEPNLAKSLRIGFDTWDDNEINDNHVLIHFNSVEVAEISLSEAGEPNADVVL